MLGKIYIKFANILTKIDPSLQETIFQWFFIAACYTKEQ